VAADALPLIWELFFEKGGFSPHARCNNTGCTCCKPSLVILTQESESELAGEELGGEISVENLSDVSEEQVQGDTPPARRPGVRRQLRSFCQECSQWADFRSNREEVRDMSFLFEAGVFKDRYISGGNLRGEVTEIEWNKFISFYLKPGKEPGPSKVPNELIKKASSIEMKILRAWANQILVAEQLTPVILCEEDVHGVISLLHKGGGTTIHPSDLHPVVLMDGMNQLLGYIVLERLTRLVEGSNVLEAGQGGYREGRGGDLNMHKIDYLARQAREQHRYGQTLTLPMPSTVSLTEHCGLLIGVFIGTQTFSVPTSSYKTLITG
jgi:hypothetical protein